MDAMVSARVPVEVKRQGDRMLKEIGSSATELVNAAYNYVIKYGSIPGDASVARSETPAEKVLRGEAAAAFNEQWGKVAVLDAPDYDGDNFRELLDRARKDRYARLA